jgi:hypothetical protein
MFIFDRPPLAVAAGLAAALLSVWVGELWQPPEAVPQSAIVSNAHPALVRAPRPGVSSAPVRDLSLSCRLPPASLASWLPSLKSRIVPDQVAARAPQTQQLFGQHSC